MVLKGIDISSHNETIDFDKVRSSGIEVVIMRCGYGKELSQKDEKFDEYYNLAYNKFKLGTYLYSYANSIETAKLEAKNTLELIKNKDFDYVFYDMEDKKAEKLSKDTITSMYFAYKEIIEQAGYKCGIYCNKNWANNKINISKIPDIKWVAAYGENNGKIPSESVKFSDCDIWQYTNQGKIDGINGNVDLNIIYNWEGKQVSIQPQKDNKGIIATIQESLNSKYGLNIGVDNIYGKETKKALVIALQIELNTQYKKDLVVDGIFGANTKNACVLVRKGARGNITYIIQAMLYCKGYNTNGVDGIFGNTTDIAVRQFQKDNGLTADGIVRKEYFFEII
ncbi:MAG: peptidoglycan-binding protein [Clostridia bacterium]|nr:peptidoglycan-binding protein [Clostridia bacterium]